MVRQITFPEFDRGALSHEVVALSSRLAFLVFYKARRSLRILATAKKKQTSTAFPCCGLFIVFIKLIFKLI